MLKYLFLDDRVSTLLLWTTLVTTWPLFSILDSNLHTMYWYQLYIRVPTRQIWTPKKNCWLKFFQSVVGWIPGFIIYDFFLFFFFVSSKREREINISKWLGPMRDLYFFKNHLFRSYIHACFQLVAFRHLKTE